MSEEEYPDAEEWRPVPNHEGHYEVSNLGRMRSLERTVIRSNGIPQKIWGRVMNPWKKNGYRAVWLGRKDWAYVHELVLTAFVGPRPPELECCHNDGDRTNNRLSNLRWDTRSANVSDSITHGTNPATSKTHCKWGHPFDEENTYVRSDARYTQSVTRTCRECDRRRGRNYRQRLAAKKWNGQVAA